MEPYFSRTVERWSLLPSGTRVLAALSGGRDSVCLLHRLMALAEERDLALAAAHLDHSMREGSGEDASFVQELCRKWEIPLFIEKSDVLAYARQEGLSPEDAARRLRYRFLYRAAEEFQADVIALAHHAGDQAETILLHLLRGSGLTGLTGMRPRSGMLIRPMLETPTDAVQAYFDENGLACVQDPSNQDLDNPRNAVRHRVLPELRKIRPEAELAFARASENLREDADALDAAAERLFRAGMKRDLQGVSCAVQADMDPAILHRLIRRTAEAAGLRQDLERIHITDLAEAVRKGSGGLDLPRGFAGRVYRGSVWIGKPAEYAREVPAEDGARCLDGQLRIGVCPAAPGEWEKRTACLQYTGKPFSPETLVRTQRPDDYLMTGTGRRTLARFWQDRRTPPWLRPQRLLLAAGSRVLWIPEEGWCDPEYYVQDPARMVWAYRLKRDGDDNADGTGL